MPKGKIVSVKHQRRLARRRKRERKQRKAKKAARVSEVPGAIVRTKGGGAYFLHS